MKKFCFGCLAAAAVMLLAGCASSERALRMSGGVLDSYSAPRKYRTRSEKFRKIEQQTQSYRANQDRLADFNESLVNIWPFYFRSRNYFSVLWPMIDWDPYGMAVRPFYNQEGDDYSILFPLIAWNPADKIGWIANFVWTDQGFGFVPLSWQHRDPENFWCYYTPFFIVNREYHKLGWDRYRGYIRRLRDNYSEFMLGYGGKSQRWDGGKWEYVLFKSFSDDWKTSARFRYDLYREKLPFPQNQQEFLAFREKVEKDARISDTYYGGFVPLFHFSRTPAEQRYYWRGPGYFFGAESSPSHFEWDVSGQWIASYKWKKESGFNYYHSARDSVRWHVVPLMSFYKRETYFRHDSPQLRKLETLRNEVSSNRSFDLKYPRVLAALKALDPQVQIPEFIKDNDLLSFFVEDFITGYCTNNPLPVYQTWSGGFLPVYCGGGNSRDNSYKWFSGVLLSGGSRDKESSYFFSIPLLTFSGKNRYREYFRIAPPFIYSDSTRFDQNRYYRKIHSANAKWPDREGENIESRDIYAACGLFYRGKVKFYVARKGIYAATANELCGKLSAVYYESRRIREREQDYAKELKLANAVKPAKKIDYYRKMVRLEELKETRAAIDLDIIKNQRNIATIRMLAKSLGLPVTVTDFTNKKQIDAMRKSVYDNCTEIREKEDIGNGLFFRRENFYNGDYKWKLFFNIAGGEKDGENENFHILHFLYRSRKEGDRSEKLIFPFISIQEKGADIRVSFLGRIWQKKVVNGKSSGYIFFFPWGDRSR